MKNDLDVLIKEEAMIFTPVSNIKNIPSLSPAAQLKGKGRSNKSANYEKNPNIQAKLTVGQPNDRFEQEADRVANRVMSMPENLRDVHKYINNYQKHTKLKKTGSFVKKTRTFVKKGLKN